MIFLQRNAGEKRVTLEAIMRDIERANGDIKNMQYELKRVPKAKEIELSGKSPARLHFAMARANIEL